MDEINNPYVPGAGLTPAGEGSLSGRLPELASFNIEMQKLIANKSFKNQIITGVPGVGKTVLLKEFSGHQKKTGVCIIIWSVHNKESLYLSC